MQVFGEGDAAVRAFSGLVSVATLPVAWVAGRRYGGRVCATAVLVVVATSPFAVRYATEARMYSLVVLLVLLGWLAVGDALARPSPLRLVAVAVVSGLLLLTHYWAIFLVVAVAGLLGVLAAAGFVLVVRAWPTTPRGGEPDEVRPALGSPGAAESAKRT